MLQLIVEDGAVLSIWIVCMLVCPALPALSQAAYSTVVVVETVNGEEYVGLASVGLLPSVV